MYREVLKNRAFLIYYIGSVSSDLGDVIANIGFLFVVYQATGSTLQTTGVAIAETLPYLLFGLVGGAVSDYLPRRTVMLFLDLSRGILQVTVCLLYSSGYLSYGLILAAVFCIQSAGCFFTPAQRALLPQIARTDELTSANALVSISASSTPILAPLITAILLTYTGLGGFFAFDAASYFVSTFCLWRLSPYLKEASTVHRETSQADTTTPLKQADMWDRLRKIPEHIWTFARFTASSPTLIVLFITTFGVVFFHTWAWQVGLLIKAETLFANGKQIYTNLLGTYAALSIMTNLFIPVRWKRLSLVHYIVGAIIWGAGILAFGLVQSLPFLFLCVAIVGLGLPLGSQSRVYLLQTEAPEELRGQAFSFAAVLLYLSNLLSLSFFGWLSDRLPLELLLTAGGAGILLVSVGSALWHSVIGKRFMQSETYPPASTDKTL